MIEFNTYTVKRKLSLFSIFCLVMFLISIIGILMKYIVQVKSNLWFLDINFILMFFIFFILIIISQKLKGAENYKIIEKLIITDEYIKLGEKIYYLNEIHNLRFDYDGVMGETHPNRNIPDGVGNKIQFKWNNKLINHRFRILNFKEKAKFLELLNSLYKGKYNFIENHQYFGRTYMLKKLNYKQIQEMKKEK